MILLIDLYGDKDMKKKYIDVKIDIMYTNNRIFLLSAEPFDGEDISIGDMDIEENMF